MDQILTISEKYQITASLIFVGEDLCVILSGGDAPHIGAVSAGVTGPGVGAAPQDLRQQCAAKKEPLTLSFPAHRDDAMSRPLAAALSKRLRKNVVVLCGIHIDDLPKEDIKAIVQLLPEIEEKIITAVLHLS